MAPFKPVKLLDQCKVSVATPTATVVPLTFFDIRWLPLPPVELLFFYEFPHPISQFTRSLLPHLKHSLSCTLIHFYPFSGNLSWPREPNHPMICYTEGDSVSFTVAESDADFYHLSSNHLKDAIESRPLVPHLPTTGPILPMLAIQVTVFPNTGICIAATFHHSVCDGRGFTHLMKTRASIYKFGAESLSPVSLPFLDRTAIKEDNGIKKIILDDLDRFMGSELVSGNQRLRVIDIKLEPNLVRATFEVNEASGRRLKEWVFCQYKKKDTQTLKQSIPPSRLVAICAYTWICLLKAKAKAGEFETDNMTAFVLHLDCRALLNPSVLETYLSNCTRGCVVNAEKADLMRGGVAVAARLIGEAIYEGRQAIWRSLEHSVSRLLKMKFSHLLGAAGSPQFRLYKTDFGIGRLKKVEMASTDRTEAMFLKESSNEEGGIEFDLVLNKKEMDAFVSVFVDGLNALNEHSLSPSTRRSLL